MTESGGSWATGDVLTRRRMQWKTIHQGTGREIEALEQFKKLTANSMYTFESSNANDSIGSNNLTENGTPTYSSSGGIDGTYITFNGTSQYLTASSSSVFDVTTGDFTICGYIYRTSDSGNIERIIMKDDGTTGYSIVLGSTDLLQALIRTGTTSSTATTVGTISTGVWYFWAATFSRNSNLTLYVYNTSTGALETQSTSITARAGSISNSQTFTVGRSSSASSQFFTGRMDDIRFYDGIALSQTQVQALYSSLSKYAFAGNGNDSVGSNNLTATGSPSYGSDGGVYGQYVILNGSSQYFQAFANTVFDVTTGDFSLWGYIYRTSDSGATEAIVRKRDTSVSTNKGYSVDIISTDKLQLTLCDGSAASITTSSTSTISINTWYFWAVSFARAGNATLYLYNLSSGAYETSSVSISTQALTISNTQTFTVGRSSHTGTNFFPGRIDHLNVLIGTAITAQNVKDIISKLHGGQIAKCHGTSSGFTTNYVYERNEENTRWDVVYDDSIRSNYGDGSDGILNVTSGTTSMAASKQYKAVHVESGATLNVGNNTLQAWFLGNRGTVINTTGQGAGGTAGSVTVSSAGGAGGAGGAPTGGGYGGGGGGGGGSSSGAGLGGTGGAGGAGGGNLTMKIKTLSNTGTITCAGTNGSNAGSPGTQGAGGGGGGGGQGATLNLTVRELLSALSISVAGGTAGAKTNGGGANANTTSAGGAGGASNSATGGTAGTTAPTDGGAGGTAASSGGGGGGGGGTLNGSLPKNGGDGAAGANGTSNITYA